jgi:hypothetical protein
MSNAWMVRAGEGGEVIDAFSRGFVAIGWQDVFDRIPEDDLKEAAVIMAAFTYNAAMMEQRFPRKAAESQP